MKASYISSQAISQALRYSMTRMQKDLMIAQKEVLGRVADPGLTLGARAGQSVSLARDVSRLQGLTDSNAQVSSRLKMTQDALSQIASRGEDLRTALSASISGDADPAILRADAAAMLEALTAMMNTSMNGEFLFAGINTDVEPIADFRDPASPNRVAFDQAFLAHFGFTQTAPGAAAITTAQMDDFIDNVVTPQFLGSGWTDNWSSASDDTIASRITLSETTRTSVSANIEGVRKLAMAATIASSLLEGPVSRQALSSVVEKALGLVAEGVAGITDQQARTGVTQRRVTAANERLSMQVDLFKLAINDLEGTDPYEAGTRMEALASQIETSYALTVRIQQLSLLRFM